MNRCRFSISSNPTRTPTPGRFLAVVAVVAVLLLGMAGCGRSSEPVEGLESTNVRPVVSPDPLAGLQPSDFTTPEESQVLQVWCVYEFDSDACVELDQKFGFNESNGFGLPADLKTRSEEVLDAECANGTQDRVSCAELASR